VLALSGWPEDSRIHFPITLLWAGGAWRADTGFLLASDTGTLIGATAIPVWSENGEMLPAHFLTSGLGGFAAILELCSFLIPAAQVFGFAASGIKRIIGIFLELRKRPVDAPLTAHVWATFSESRDCYRAEAKGSLIKVRGSCSA
jgi:hypothetical protein